MDRIHFEPGWTMILRRNLTCGAIDLAYASREVLRALGIPDDFVDRFLQVPRAGWNRWNSRRRPVGSTSAFAMLGLNNAQLRSKGFKPQSSFKSPMLSSAS